MNARRGDVWTAAGGGDFLTKPRPVIIIQSRAPQPGESVTVCLLSTAAQSHPPFRARLEPTEQNGLLAPSVAMADMVTTVRASRLGRRIGHLSVEELALIEAALTNSLGLNRRTD